MHLVSEGTDWWSCMGNSSEHDDAGGDRAGSAVDRALGSLRRMIFEGQLLPGTPVRQAAVAEHLGMSRVPVREALKLLEGDGVLVYELNVGFRVAELSPTDIGQIYLMRRLLETELLSRMPRQHEQDMTEFELLNRKMAAANKLGDLAEFMRLNRRFHFAMFDRCGLPLVVAKVAELWDLAAPYNAMYGSSTKIRTQVVGEHVGLINALRNGDNADLVAKMNGHREQSISRQSGSKAVEVAKPNFPSASA